jgi:hypothetical protein
MASTKFEESKEKKRKKESHIGNKSLHCRCHRSTKKKTP